MIPYEDVGQDRLVGKEHMTWAVAHKLCSWFKDHGLTAVMIPTDTPEVGVWEPGRAPKHCYDTTGESYYVLMWDRVKLHWRMIRPRFEDHGWAEYLNEKVA